MPRHMRTSSTAWQPVSFGNIDGVCSAVEQLAAEGGWHMSVNFLSAALASMPRYSDIGGCYVRRIINLVDAANQAPDVRHLSNNFFDPFSNPLGNNSLPDNIPRISLEVDREGSFHDPVFVLRPKTLGEIHKLSINGRAVGFMGSRITWAHVGAIEQFTAAHQAMLDLKWAKIHKPGFKRTGADFFGKRLLKSLKRQDLKHAGGEYLWSRRNKSVVSSPDVGRTHPAFPKQTLFGPFDLWEGNGLRLTWQWMTGGVPACTGGSGASVTWNISPLDQFTQDTSAIKFAHTIERGLSGLMDSLPPPDFGAQSDQDVRVFVVSQPKNRDTGAPGITGSKESDISDLDATDCGPTVPDKMSPLSDLSKTLSP